MPEGAHPMPALDEETPEWEKEILRRQSAEILSTPKPGSPPGWQGIGFVNNDGMNWPLSVAAKLLEIDEKDLRDMVRISRLQPAGEIRMSSYSRQGRQPRAYPATKLIKLAEVITDLRNDL